MTEKFCKYCGCKIFEKDRCCLKCGAPIYETVDLTVGSSLNADCVRFTDNGYAYLTCKSKGDVTIITNDYTIYEAVAEENNSIYIKELANELCNCIYEV